MSHSDDGRLKNTWLLRHPVFSALCISLVHLVVVSALQHRLMSAYLSGADLDLIQLLSYCAGVATGSLMPLWLPFVLRLFTLQPQVCFDDVRGRGRRFCASLWGMLSGWEFAFVSSIFTVERFFSTQLLIPIKSAKEAVFLEAYTLLAYSITGLWNGVLLGFLILAAIYKGMLPAGTSVQAVPDSRESD